MGCDGSRCFKISAKCPISSHHVAGPYIIAPCGQAFRHRDKALPHDAIKWVISSFWKHCRASQIIPGVPSKITAVWPVSASYDARFLFSPTIFMATMAFRNTLRTILIHTSNESSLNPQHYGKKTFENQIIIG